THDDRDLGKSQSYPRPVSAGISTLTRIAPSQSSMEIRATTLAVTGLAGARSHFGRLHSMASAETTASTMTSILRRKGVTAAKSPASTANSKKPETATAPNPIHLHGRSCSASTDRA